MTGREIAGDVAVALGVAATGVGLWLLSWQLLVVAIGAGLVLLGYRWSRG